MSSTPNKTYGYARVSTKDQNLDRQLIALAEHGVDGNCIYTDKATGANFKRPGYMLLLKRLRKGDLLVIASIDRLGRDYDEIQEQWRRITKAIGADVEVLDMPLLNTRNGVDGLTGVFMADIALQIMSYMAHMERAKTKDRQREGIEAAKARGAKFGRPPLQVPPEFSQVYTAYLRKEMNRQQCARALGVSPSTFDRWRKSFAAGVLCMGE